MKRKKILYVITKSNLGGAQRYVLELATSLPRDQYEPTVACGGNGLLVERLKADNIPVHTIRSFERDISLKKEYTAMKELYSLIRDLQPDIVHVNSSKAGGIGALVARVCGVQRIIFTAHGWPFYEQRNIFSRFIMWFFSYLTVLIAHQTIVVSLHDRTHARMWGLSHKITHIPIGLTPIPFDSKDDARETLFTDTVRERQKDKLWLVSTGELTRNKNLSLILKAIASLTPPNRARVFLTLIGDGELKASLTEEITRLSIHENVCLLGFVPEARLFLKAFNIFLIPSLKEGLPYGLLEAGSAHLACIGSRVGGIPEVIEDGRGGILIDPQENAELKDALTTFIENDALRLAYGEALGARVHSQFSFTKMLESTRVLYDS